LFLYFWINEEKVTFIVFLAVWGTFVAFLLIVIGTNLTRYYIAEAKAAKEEEERIKNKEIADDELIANRNKDGGNQVEMKKDISDEKEVKQTEEKNTLINREKI